jgi:hypothetical protein
VVVAGTQQRFRFVAPAYWLIGVSILIVILCGILTNGVGSGVIVAGVRYYLRAAPFLLLPAVYEFKEWQIRSYSRLVAAICLLQCPVAVLQRFTLESSGHESGDDVYGTLMASGTLSLFIICAICVMTALYMTNKMRLWTYMLLFLVMLIPMSINETKVTVILLPLGLMWTTWLASPRGLRVRRSLIATAVIILAGCIFVPIYNYYNLYHQPGSFTLSDFFSNKHDLMKDYLSTDARVGTDQYAGRVDDIVVPIEELSRDPAKLAFGVGLGNASKSSLGPNFSGVYYPIYWRYLTSSGTFLLETGVVGLALILLLHWQLARDALAVSRTDPSVVGAMATAWPAVVMVMTAGLFYITLHISEAASYVFFLFSGIFAAQRMRLHGSPERVTSPPNSTAVDARLMAASAPPAVARR